MQSLAAGAGLALIAWLLHNPRRVTIPALWKSRGALWPTRFLLDQPNMPPTIFIGSSAEGLHIAEALQLGLGRVATCTLWTQGVFGLTQGTLKSLVEATKTSDFAIILVLTPDDLATKRGKKKCIPRDNVIFELGLFMGALGQARTFYVRDRDQAIELPTDLAGHNPRNFPRQREFGIRTRGSLYTDQETVGK